jgi:hypothetical protein
MLMYKFNEQVAVACILFGVPLLMLFSRDEDSGKFRFFESLSMIVSYFFNILLVIFAPTLFWFCFFNIVFSIITYIFIGKIFLVFDSMILIILLMSLYKTKKDYSMSQSYIKLRKDIHRYIKLLLE